MATKEEERLRALVASLEAEVKTKGKTKLYLVKGTVVRKWLE
jgi:hypothetical protein